MKAGKNYQTKISSQQMVHLKRGINQQGKTLEQSEINRNHVQNYFIQKLRPFKLKKTIIQNQKINIKQISGSLQREFSLQNKKIIREQILCQTNSVRPCELILMPWLLIKNSEIIQINSQIFQIIAQEQIGRMRLPPLQQRCNLQYRGISEYTYSIYPVDLQLPIKILWIIINQLPQQSYESVLILNLFLSQSLQIHFLQLTITDRATAYSVFGQMNSARIFASRNHIIKWINQVLKIRMTKIQQLGSGVIYCLLLDCGYPQRVPLTKLKWYANNEIDFIHNFKILQNSFSHLGIDKRIQINKLVQAKYQENLDFIQWLKWFLQPKIYQKQYDPKKRCSNRSVYLEFYQHKILKIPSESHKTKQKSSVKNKHNINTNKKQKKIYNTKSNFFQIYEYKSDQSDHQINIIEDKKYSIQKQKLLKTSHKLIGKKPNISITAIDESIVTNDKPLDQDNKENAHLSMNNATFYNESLTSLQCMYNSPKQIRKFFFPQRFSQRLKRRVDVINGIRKSEVKRIEEKQPQTLEKYLGTGNEKHEKKRFLFIDEEDSEVQMKEEVRHYEER